MCLQVFPPALTQPQRQFDGVQLQQVRTFITRLTRE